MDSALPLRHAQDSSDLARALFEEAADALFLFDPDNEQLLDVSAAALRLTGFERAPLLRMPASYLFRYEGNGGKERLRAASQKSGVHHPQEGYLLRTSRDGVWVPVSLSVSRLHVRPRTLALFTARDVRERREADRQLKRVEQELAQVTAAIAACLWSAEVDSSGRWEYKYWSAAVEKITGRPPAFFFPGPARWAEIVHPEDRPSWRAALGRLRGSDGGQAEYRIVWPDGLVRWVRESVTVSPRDGRGLRLDAVVSDVTERRAAEEAARESDRRFRQLIEQAGDAIFVHDEHGRFLEVNQCACDSLGYSRDELLRLTAADVEVGCRPGDHPEAEEQMRRGLPVTVDGVHRRKDGSTFPVEVRVALLRSAGRDLKLALARDVTERRRAEEALRDQRAMLQSVVDHAPCAVFWKDRNSVYLGCNVQSARDLGLTSPAEAVGKVDRDLQFAPEEADFYVACDHRVLQSGQAMLNFEETQLRANGSRAVLLTSKVPLRSAGGEVVGVLGIYTDITDRKGMEEALRQSEQRYREVVEGSIQGIAIYQGERIVFVNQALARMFGYDEPAELLKMDPELLIAPEDRILLHGRQETCLRGDLVPLLEWQGLRKDGSRVWIQSTATAITWNGRPAVLSTRLDITERKRLEAQLRQAQKMEAVGRLAGGIAHDFNNLIQVITGCGEVVLGDLPALHPCRDLVREMKNAGDRAAALTRQLLAFSRQQILAPRLLDLGAVAQDTSRLLRRLIGEDVELVTAAEPGLGLVRADPNQVEQVLLNLAVNARDAMPQGGKLTIETCNVELDEGYARANPDARPGPHVLLAVSDTGQGMDEATRSRVFEPFFTTKGERGTGLGLATVYGIVRQSDGHVTVYSEVGRGTTFKVYLPRVLDGVPTAPAEVVRAAPPRGSETVLLVEDEDGVRALAGYVLRDCGYEVLEARNGAEALRVAGGHTGQIELVVTDVVMPQMGGREVAERVAALHPEARVLFLSGYTDDAIVRHGILEEEVAFLQKPFTTAALARKVREVLDGREG